MRCRCVDALLLLLNLLSGLDRSSFDNKSVSFEEHCMQEHNMWHYLFFIVLVKVKDPTEFTGPESYVYAMIKVSSHCFILEHYEVLPLLCPHVLPGTSNNSWRYCVLIYDVQ